MFSIYGCVYQREVQPDFILLTLLISLCANRLHKIDLKYRMNLLN